jgi:hypothetical protein
MNSQETLNHIELKLTQLITHTEMLKYYLMLWNFQTKGTVLKILLGEIYF